MKRAYERLLDYVVVHTTSDEESETVPSAAREFDLAKKLVQEMKEIGIADAHVDDKCYVYGTLEATDGLQDKPAIGYIAHMDTAPDFSGEHVHPLLHERCCVRREWQNVVGKRFSTFAECTGENLDYNRWYDTVRCR